MASTSKIFIKTIKEFFEAHPNQDVESHDVHAAMGKYPRGYFSTTSDSTISQSISGALKVLTENGFLTRSTIKGGFNGGGRNFSYCHRTSIDAPITEYQDTSDEIDFSGWEEHIKANDPEAFAKIEDAKVEVDEEVKIADVAEEVSGTEEILMSAEDFRQPHWADEYQRKIEQAVMISIHNNACNSLVSKVCLLENDKPANLEILKSLMNSVCELALSSGYTINQLMEV